VSFLQCNPGTQLLGLSKSTDGLQQKVITNERYCNTKIDTFDELIKKLILRADEAEERSQRLEASLKQFVEKSVGELRASTTATTNRLSSEISALQGDVEAERVNRDAAIDTAEKRIQERNDKIQGEHNVRLVVIEKDLRGGKTIEEIMHVC